jgi:hypothetical protein
MTRSLLIVLVLALAGSALGAPAALAQESASNQSGVTTTGYGLATTSAESANLQFLIINEDFYGGSPPFPEVEATPGANARASVAPIVEVIEASDSVESVDVVIPVIHSQYGPTPLARIDATVLNPDLEMLTSLIVDITQAAAVERLLVGYVGAVFIAPDCGSLEREARQAALDEARSRAELQVELLGAGLGEVIAATDLGVTSGPGFGSFGDQLVQSGGCAPQESQAYGGEFSFSVTLPRFDPASHSGNAEVHVLLQVTFAIEGSAAIPVA